MADYDACLALDPQNAHAHHNRGIGLQQLRRHHEAADAFTRAIELDEGRATQANAYFMRGQALDAAGEYERAVKDFTRALHLDASAGR